MKTRNEKNRELLARFEYRGIVATPEQVDTLRRAELTLQRWYEQECGDGNERASWAIIRDEETGKPFMEIHPNAGSSYRRAIADKERGAIARIDRVCKAMGIHYYIQTDPRGCTLYVDKEPLPENNYTRGIACCS